MTMQKARCSLFDQDAERRWENDGGAMQDSADPRPPDATAPDGPSRLDGREFPCLSLTSDRSEARFDRPPARDGADGCYMSAKTFTRRIQAPDAEKPTMADEHDLRCGFIKGCLSMSRELLVQANASLVATIALHYTGRGVAMQDLIEHGTLGLIHAADDFDPAKGLRFSSHAGWWIKQAMRLAIRHPNHRLSPASAGVRVPTSSQEIHTCFAGLSHSSSSR